MNLKTLAAVLFALVAAQAQPAPPNADDQSPKDHKSAFAKHKEHKGYHKKKGDSRKDRASKAPPGSERKAEKVEPMGGDQMRPGHKPDRVEREDAPQPGPNAREDLHSRKNGPAMEKATKPEPRPDRERPEPEPDR